MLSKNEYENRFMIELENAWNMGQRENYLTWESFVYSMWIQYKEGEE